MSKSSQAAWEKYNVAALTFDALDKFLDEHFKHNADLKAKWISENTSKLSKIPSAEAWVGHDMHVDHPVELMLHPDPVVQYEL